MKIPRGRKKQLLRKVRRAKPEKPEKVPQITLICGGCANDIAPDDTAGTGGCGMCFDGIPRCGDCHEEHCGECDGDGG